MVTARGAYGKEMVLAGALSICLHLLVIWLMPVELKHPTSRPVSIEVEVVPSPSVEAPLDFVEPNPDVPENEPDTAEHTAARDQQAAQEEATEALLGEQPHFLGEVDDSQAIIEGSLDEPAFSSASGDLQQKLASERLGGEQTLPAKRSTAVMDFLTEAQGGEGADVPKGQEKEKRAELGWLDLSADPNRREGMEGQGAEVLEVVSAESSLGKKKVPRVVPGPIRTTFTRISSLGRVAIDARFSPFGDYLERMLEAITSRWHLLVQHSNGAFFQDTGTWVKIRFYLTQEGLVEDLAVVETTSTRTATLLCKDAVLSRVPFGAWPDEISAIVGEKDQIQITFNYK